MKYLLFIPVKIQHNPRKYVAIGKALQDIIGCGKIAALYQLLLCQTQQKTALQPSHLVPTNEPRIVLQLATTSNGGVWKLPEGKPTNTQMPP